MGRALTQLEVDMADTCSHVAQADVAARPSSEGCEDCLAIGARWVHLRMCRDCGHVGCCDSSPNKHASAHFEATTHPLMSSYEKGEDWWWCFVDQKGFFVPDFPEFAHP
jgi:uncharacterized UBP type Zn finger protein